MNRGVATVATTPYEQHRDYVLTVLRRRCGWLDATDREAAFHDAYAVLLQKEQEGELDPDDMHDRQLRAYLLQTALNKALDEGKRAERNRTVPLGEGALEEPDLGRSPEDDAALSLDNARVREIVAELPENQRTIVKLRFFFDRSPEEIREFMGITERSYRRALERAMREISERFDLVQDGSFCDTRRSLILAYVAGIAGPNRARAARRHLEGCPGCSHWAAELRTAAQGAAAVIPLPQLAGKTPTLQALGDVTASLRETVFAVPTTIKHQVLSLLTRADPHAPMYASGARPGTLATAVAGCVVLGSGATYCVTEVVPGSAFSILPGQHATEPAPRREAARRPARRAPVARPRVTPVRPRPQQPPARAKRPAPRRPAAPRPQPQPQPPSPARREFGLEGSGQSSGQGNAPAAPAPRPSPPPQPPGEFDP